MNTTREGKDLVDRVIATVSEPKNQPVFICGTANRVATLWLITRVEVDGWPLQRALDEAAAPGLTSEPLKKCASTTSRRMRPP